jgi:hypothetical protein
MNLPTLEHFPNTIRSLRTLHINQLNIVFLTSLALSTLWAPCIKYNRIISHSKHYQLIEVRTQCTNRYLLHFQFEIMTHLPIHLQFQSLSRCLILEGSVFSDVQTVTV